MNAKLCLLFLCLGLAYSSRPNIIITIGSGVGWGDIGTNNPFNTHTSVIDALASSGISYLDYHVGGNTAGPSMAALLTGRHGQRNGVRADFTVKSVGGLSVKERTIAEYLKTSGYVTGFIGVWDLGHRTEFLPHARGFDYFYGTPFDPSQGCVHLNEQFVPPDCHVDLSCSSGRVNIPLMEGNEILQQPVHAQNISEPIFYAKAKRFVYKAIKQKQPFFLILSLTMIKLPVFSINNDSPTKENLLKRLDKVVGMTQELLQTFSLEQNSISIFTSRTGPKDSNCDLSGDVGPYAGYWQRMANSLSAPTMGSNWEGGTRVPFVVSWPQGIVTPHLNTRLTSAVDLVPTLAEVVGFDLPSDRAFDGISMFKEWKGNQEDQATSRVLYFLESDTNQVMAFRKDGLKIYFRTSGARSCNASSDPNPAGIHHPYPLVFDLTWDQGELQNISYSTALATELLLLKQSADDMFKQDSRLKSTADYSESPSAIICCGKFSCSCSSPPPIADLKFLFFGDKKVDLIIQNNTIVIMDDHMDEELVPLYGLVFICLGMGLLVLFVTYRSYAIYVRKRFGYHEPMWNKEEMVRLLSKE